LRLAIKKEPARGAVLTLVERCRELAREADRLQLCAEQGMEVAQFDRAMRALQLRMKLLEMENSLGRQGKVNGQNIGAALQDAAEAEGADEGPEEQARLEREYAEICGDKE
jgi:hypothetical protein